MSNGKPWDHPDSDPAADIEEYVEAGRRSWLPTDGRVETGSMTLNRGEWAELEDLGRVTLSDGRTALKLGEGRIFIAPAGASAPGGTPASAELDPLEVTVSGTRLFGKPYTWVRHRKTGHIRLHRVPTDPVYDELVRAHLDLAGANPAFRGVQPRRG